LKIIGLVGMPGCGKEEFLKIAMERGISVVRMGDIVRAEVRKKELKLIDKNVGSLADRERKRFGYGVWAERTIPYIENETTIIDGIRGIEEVNVFKKKYGKSFVLVGTNASFEIRYQRIRKRKRKDDRLSAKQFKRRGEREESWGIRDAMKMADYNITNEGTLKEFRKKVERVLGEILPV
jgi:dephospho-CoA kinase